MAFAAGFASQRIDRVMILGDLVGYGGDPGAVLDIVMTLVAEGGEAVLGNHDAAAIHGPDKRMNDDAALAIQWTRSQLRAAHLAFLGALPLSVEREDALFVHANAWNPARWGYVRGRQAAARRLAATACRYTFCGHVHEPALYHRSDAGEVAPFRPVPGVAIPLGRQRRWLALPGSLGQPRDGDPAACYGVFDTEARQMTFHRVPYDCEAAAARMLAAGLPARLAQRLIDGR